MSRRWGSSGEAMVGQQVTQLREWSGRPTVLVRLLGPVEVVGLDRSLTSQQLSLVVYLATVGPADRQQLADAIWGGRLVSAGRVANLISELRRALGSDRLPAASGGRYRLVDVTTDVDLLADLARRQARPGDDEAIDSLERGLGLVRGPVLGVSTRRYWGWLDLHPELAGQAEVAVSTVARRLVSALRAAGQHHRAGLACERALACLPLDRELVLMLEGVYQDQGRPASAQRLIEGWRSGVARIGGEDPRPSSVQVR